MDKVDHFGYAGILLLPITTVYTWLSRAPMWRMLLGAAFASIFVALSYFVIWDGGFFSGWLEYYLSVQLYSFALVAIPIAMGCLVGHGIIWCGTHLTKWSKWTQ